MGYQAPLNIADGADAQWVGEHRPELLDLEPLFRRIVSLDVAAVEAGPATAMEAWRAALPEDVVIVRELTPRAVQLHVPRGAVVREIVLKLMVPRPDRGWRRLTERMERSRSHRAHLWAHRLRAIGIDAPRPLGFLERAERPSRFPSFAVSEYVFAETLVKVGEERMQMIGASPTGPALAEKRALIHKVAEVLRTMHAHGVFHGDLHPGNILIRRALEPAPPAAAAPDRASPGSPSPGELAAAEVFVIDLESMRTFTLAERARIKSLVRLNRAFLDTRLITRTDRLRFLTTYLRHHGARAERTRELWARVLDKTRLKLSELGQVFS